MKLQIVTNVLMIVSVMVLEHALMQDGVQETLERLMVIWAKETQSQKLFVTTSMNVESFADQVLLLVNVIVKVEKLIAEESVVVKLVLMSAVSVMDQVCLKVLVTVMVTLKIVMESAEEPLFLMYAVSVTVQVSLNTNVIVKNKS